MPTITSAQSGRWSQTSTWVGGVLPANGDSVVIAAGHTVEFDVDTSGMTNGIAGVTVNGALRAYTQPGTYVLKLTASVTFGASGRLEAGSAETPYPSSCRFIIQANGNINAISGGTNAVDLYCATPTNPYALLANAANAGDTVLTLDRSLTGDLWQAGDVVVIANVNKGRNAETRTIASVNGNQITLTSGLASSKLAGSYVTLASRNVEIVQVSGSVTGTGVNGGTGHVLRCAIRGHSSGIYGCIGYQVSGGVISGCLYGILGGSGYQVSGGVISGCFHGIYGCIGYQVSGSVISGCDNGINSSIGYQVSGSVISGCGIGINSSIGYQVSGSVISGCGIGIYGSDTWLLTSTLRDNIYDLNWPAGVGYGTVLASAQQAVNYSDMRRGFVAWDIGGVQGAVKAWMAGGTIVPDTTVYPAGFTRSHRMIFERAVMANGITTAPLHLDYPLAVDAGTRVRATVWLRRDQASMTELPRVQLIDPTGDPLLVSGGAPLWEQVMAAGVDTWEQIEVDYTAPRAVPGLVLRVLARNAAGNAWFQVRILSPVHVLRQFSATISRRAISVPV